MKKNDQEQFLHQNSIEGVILSKRNHEGKDYLFTLFSEGGLSHFFYSGTKNAKTPCDPLTLVEVDYIEKNSGLHKCSYLKNIDAFLFLRRDLAYINTAVSFCKDLLKTQFEQKPAPLLYRLFLSHLKMTPHLRNLNALAVNFKLKILTHEGFIDFEHTDFSDFNKITNKEINFFSANEWHTVRKLALTVNYRDLEEIYMDEIFAKKTNEFFEFITNS